MTNRIMAALDYLDAHSSPMLMKQKQRPLGDIEAKYNAGSSFDLPFDLLVDGNVVLSGTSRTNLSRDKSLDQILDEDREKIAMSAQRSKSASFQKNPSSCRPQTSLSSGSALLSRNTHRQYFRSNPRIPSSSPSKTSTKKLTFTPPGIHVGPSDARDEVMEEIVNKPLTHTPAKVRGSSPSRPRTTSSAPVLGQQGRINFGSSRSMTSLSRFRTSRGRSRNGESESQRTETKPGPFKTVKVSGPDLWVVSSSTPISYFDGDPTDQRSSTQPSLAAKSSWEDTANSVPHEEKKSPPRHERQLGAPPQFGPTQQWYSFAGGAQSKQKPVLTAFADETDNEYYSIESRVSQKVAALLKGSPGIRIGINGQVVSQSMKIDKEQEKRENDSSDELIEEENSGSKTSVENNKELDEISEQSENQSHHSGTLSESSKNNKDEDSVYTQEKEDKQYSLLRYLGIARGDNPYVVESSSESSSTDVLSLLNSLQKSSKPTTQNTYNEQEESLWKILEGASPTLWISKERWKTMQAMAQLKKEMASKIEDNPGPLSWQDQLKQDDDKIVEPRLKSNEEDKNLNKDRTPVIFHKLIDYKNLPLNFVHLTSNGYQTHSTLAAVDKDLDLSAPSKGFANTVSALPKTSKSVASMEDFSSKIPLFHRPYTSQSHRKGDSFSKKISPNLTESGVSCIKSLPNISIPMSESVEEKIAGTKTDDVTKEELNAIRMEAAQKMKMTGGALEETVAILRQLDTNRSLGKVPNEKQLQTDELLLSRSFSKNSLITSSSPVKVGETLASVDIKSLKKKSSAPVSALNFSEIEDSCYPVNGPTPTPAHSARDTTIAEVKESGIAINPSHVNEGNPPMDSLKTPGPFYCNKEESIPSSPSHPDRQASSSTRNRYFTDASSRINRGSKSGSFLTRTSSVSPRSNVASLNQNQTREVQTRSAEGFPESPPDAKTLYKLQNNLICGALKINKIGKMTSQTPIMPHGNTYSDLITKSGFIQISHPVPISQQRPSSVAIGSGNKMYDSYMRELSTRSGRSSHDAESAADKSGAVIGKRLGGSSSKLLPEYFRRARQSGVTLAGVKAGRSGFAIQSGRRSGLAITSEQSRSSHANTRSKEMNRLGQGLQGDQLRLNLDKNIHVIYRDLGIPKKTSKPSSLISSRRHSRSSEKSVAASQEKRETRSASRRSDSPRSRALSAKSHRTSTPSDRVSTEDFAQASSLSSEKLIDPTMDSLKIDLTDGDYSDGKEEENRSVESATNEIREKHQIKEYSESSEKVLSVDIADSGTQWSPHLYTSPKSTSNLATIEPGVHFSSGQPSSEQTDHESENVAKSKEISSAGFSLARQMEPRETRVDQIDEKTMDSEVGQMSMPSDPSTKRERSAFDGPIRTTDKDPDNVDDETDIRGVTKVTVNIAPSGQTEAK